MATHAAKNPTRPKKPLVGYSRNCGHDVKPYPWQSEVGSPSICDGIDSDNHDLINCRVGDAKGWAATLRRSNNPGHDKLDIPECSGFRALNCFGGLNVLGADWLINNYRSANMRDPHLNIQAGNVHVRGNGHCYGGDVIFRAGAPGNTDCRLVTVEGQQFSDGITCGEIFAHDTRVKTCVTQHARVTGFNVFALTMMESNYIDTWFHPDHLKTDPDLPKKFPESCCVRFGPGSNWSRFTEGIVRPRPGGCAFDINASNVTVEGTHVWADDYTLRFGPEARECVIDIEGARPSSIEFGDPSNRVFVNGKTVGRAA